MPATKLNRVVCHKDWTGSPSHAGLQTFRGTSISSTASHSVVLRSAGGEESQRPSVPLVAVGHISEKKNITGVDGLKIKYLQCIPVTKLTRTPTAPPFLASTSFVVRATFGIATDQDPPFLTSEGVCPTGWKLIARRELVVSTIGCSS